MNKLAIISLLFVASCRANLDTRVWVHNQSPVPLMVEGPGWRRLVLLPGEEASYCDGQKTGVRIYHWCPTASSPYKFVRVYLAALESAFTRSATTGHERLFAKSSVGQTLDVGEYSRINFARCFEWQHLLGGG